MLTFQRFHQGKDRMICRLQRKGTRYEVEQYCSHCDYQMGFRTRTVAAAEAAQISNSVDAILTFTFFKLRFHFLLCWINCNNSASTIVASLVWLSHTIKIFVIAQILCWWKRIWWSLHLVIWDQQQQRCRRLLSRLQRWTHSPPGAAALSPAAAAAERQRITVTRELTHPPTVWLH